MIDDLVLPPDLAGKPVWDIGDVQRVFPFSTSHLRALIRQGKFPAPFKLVGKLVWYSTPLVSFLRTAASNSEAKRAA